MLFRSVRNRYRTLRRLRSLRSYPEQEVEPEELDELHKRIAGQIVSERKLAKKASVPVIQEMLDGLEDEED